MQCLILVNMELNEQIGGVFAALERKSAYQVVKLNDLVKLCKSAYHIEEQAVKDWAVSEQMCKRLDSSILGVEVYLATHN